MSDFNNQNSSSRNGALAFIVGGLVVAVAVLAWFFYAADNDGIDGGAAGGVDDVDVSIENSDPAVSDDGEAAESGASGEVSGEASGEN